MKLKITTDGTPNGTKITNTETGEQLENKCTSVNVLIRPTGVVAEVVLLSDNIVLDGEFQVSKLRQRREHNATARKGGGGKCMSNKKEYLYCAKNVLYNWAHGKNHCDGPNGNGVEKSCIGCNAHTNEEDLVKAIGYYVLRKMGI